MPSMKIVLGPPGTGKTTALLNYVHLLEDVPPQRIGYVAFTRVAAREARSRLRWTDDEMVYFRTLHSLCFRQLGLQRSRVMDKRHVRTLGEQLGLDLREFAAEDGDWRAAPKGARLLFLENMARLRCVPLRALFDETNNPTVGWNELEYLAHGIKLYKEAHGLVDFSDMLEQFAEGAGMVPELDALFVDEAQDLSALQWHVVERLKREANPQTIVVAGDDDQAIYDWAGADVDAFINLQGAVQVLTRSYRVPRAMQAMATELLHLMQTRRPKEWHGRAAAGVVEFEPDIGAVDMSSGKWLVLARNTFLLNRAAELCRQRGWLYSHRHVQAIQPTMLRAVLAWERWRKGEGQPEDQELFRDFIHHPEDALTSRPWFEALDKLPPSEVEYIRALRRSGEKLLAPPRIRLSTIHSAKGDEEDNVVLFTDMARRSWQEWYTQRSDSELRVWYVAVTRAREKLFVIEPSSRFAFPLLSAPPAV